MKQYLIYIGLTAIALLLAYNNVRIAIHTRSKDKAITELQNKLQECLDAKQHIDTTYITKYVETPTIHTITVTDSVILSDTVFVPPVLRYYADSVQMTDLTLHYKAQTLGQLKWVKFAYNLRQPKITEANIIYRDSITVRRIKPTFTAYLFAEAGINDAAVSAGAMATYKGLGATYRYDITNNRHNAGVVVKLK